jgi:hypothetical protein
MGSCGSPQECSTQSECQPAPGGGIHSRNWPARGMRLHDDARPQSGRRSHGEPAGG